VKVVGWIFLLLGAALIASAFAVPAMQRPSELEVAAARLDAATGRNDDLAQQAQDASDAKDTRNILLFCGLGAAIVGAIFTAAGSRPEPRRD
jgi:hypothetical protein